MRWLHLWRYMGVAILGGALLASIWWWIRTRELEPVITSLVLIAAILGTFVDRWAAERERRRALLRTLVHEIYLNVDILEDEAFQETSTGKAKVQPLPRVHLSTLQAVISSGVFDYQKDRKLFNLMFAWLNAGASLNRRLDAIETWLFFNKPPQVEVDRTQRLLSSGKAMLSARRYLGDLFECLVQDCTEVSGIDPESVFFAKDGAVKVAASKPPLAEN